MFAKFKAECRKWVELTPDNSLYDRSLIWLFFLLLAIGFVMVTSASIAEGTRLHNSAFYYAIREVAYLVIALVACIAVIQIPSERWGRHYVWFLFLAIGLLTATLIVGKNVNGSTRWIAIGPINIQSAEIAKLAIICYFASFYTRKFAEMREKKWGIVRPASIFLIFALLLYAQPDLGSIAVICVLTFAMFFFMGAKKFVFFIFGFLALFLFVLSVITSEYRMKRVNSFIDPFSDIYGSGYQLANGQMAFGQGEIWGKGLGNSVQKLGYLPEAHTDFITAIIGEEFGLFGVLLLVVILVALTFRSLKISRDAMLLEERFRGFFAFGIGIWIFIQGFVNLGASSGVLPTKGLTFPLVSYGGSSLVIMAIAIGILLRIDHENRLVRIGHAHLNHNE